MTIEKVAPFCAAMQQKRAGRGDAKAFSSLTPEGCTLWGLGDGIRAGPYEKHDGSCSNEEA
jgi:hypothetical protein